MKFIIGKKMGMTQIFREDGTVVPVTRVQAGPCVVTQVKTQEKEGVNAVQIGFGSQKVFRLTKPEKGHLKDITVDNNAQMTVRHLHDFKNNNELKRGDTLTVAIFEPGEKIQVTGNSKGKGFQGVVKRHGFKGSAATHGHKDQLRMPGSIGAGGVQRVFKNMRMAGHMGDEQVTVKNLEIVQIDTDNNELFIKGAVPGARNAVLYISTPGGSIEITQAEPEKVASIPEAEEVKTTETVEVEKSTEATTTQEEKKEESQPEVEQVETKEEKPQA